MNSAKNPLNHFGKRILIYSLILFSIIALFDQALNLIIKNSRSLEINSFRNLSNETFDIIFVGNSRTSHHVNPEVFIANGKKAMNLGITGGTTHAENYFLLEQFLLKNKAKKIILEYLPSETSKKPLSFKKMLIFSNEIFLDEYFKYYNYSDFQKIPFFRFVLNNYNWKNALYDIYLIVTSQSKSHFTPKKGSLISSESITKFNYPNEDLWFDKIIQLGMRNNAEVIYVISPYYNMDVQVRNIPAEVRNYSNVIQEKKMFYDNFHLNNVGAENYSKFLYDEIY